MTEAEFLNLGLQLRKCKPPNKLFNLLNTD